MPSSAVREPTRPAASSSRAWPPGTTGCGPTLGPAHRIPAAGPAESADLGDVDPSGARLGDGRGLGRSGGLRRARRLRRGLGAPPGRPPPESGPSRHAGHGGRVARRRQRPRAPPGRRRRVPVRPRRRARLRAARSPLRPLSRLPPASTPSGALDGYVPPQYGLRSGGVVELRSSAAAATGAGWGGRETRLWAAKGPGRPPRSFESTVGSRGRGPGERLEASGRHRFLDPVDPRTRHNDGNAMGDDGAANLRARCLGTRWWRAGGYGESRFEVPNDGETRKKPGRISGRGNDGVLASASWLRTFSPRTTTSQAALYGRWTRGPHVPSSAVRHAARRRTRAHAALADGLSRSR